jgi:hypothetical protein
MGLRCSGSEVEVASRWIGRALLERIRLRTDRR